METTLALAAPILTLAILTQQMTMPDTTLDQITAKLETTTDTLVTGLMIQLTVMVAVLAPMVMPV